MTTEEGVVVKLAREASYLGGVLDHAIVDLDSNCSGYGNELRKLRDDLTNAFGDNAGVDPPEQHSPSSLGGDDPGAIPVWKCVEMEMKRRDNEIVALEKALHEARLGDPTGDLIQANRDAIMAIQREGLGKAQRLLNDGKPIDARSVIAAALEFHPMHAEAWCGWPREAPDA